MFIFLLLLCSEFSCLSSGKIRGLVVATSVILLTPLERLAIGCFPEFCRLMTQPPVKISLSIPLLSLYDPLTICRRFRQRGVRLSSGFDKRRIFQGFTVKPIAQEWNAPRRPLLDLIPNPVGNSRFSLVARAGGLCSCSPTLEGAVFYRPLTTVFRITSRFSESESVWLGGIKIPDPGKKRTDHLL